MAEITPDLLEEFQKPADLAFGGRLIQTVAPPEPVFTERQGFFGNVVDVAQRSSVASFFQWQTDNLYHGDDPNFDLKTYLEQNPDRQPYAHIFADARTQRYADDRWDRFKNNLQLDQRIADSEAFWSRLVIDVATDPLNLIPGAGLRRGVGIIEGIVRGAGASLPASVVDAAIRMKYDPNASFDDVKEQFLYTTAIMGVLGGGIGILKPGRDVSGLAKDLIDESRRLAGDPPVGYKPKNPADESPVVLHTVPHDATGSYRPFEAQPTGDTPVGFASAYGLEKVAGQQSAFARLANAGYRATEDLANRLAGDYGVRFARAERFEAPEPSASLAATKWSAEAGDAISKIRNAHARYLTGGTESLEVAGLNVRSTLAGVGDTFRGLFDKPRSDGKLTFQEFKEEIFKAHRADKIEHPIPEVEEAAKAIRPFFDNILSAQLKAGYIRNPTWATGYRGRLTAELSEIRQQIQDLRKNETRTVNQEALLRKLDEHLKLVENELNDVTAMLNIWKAELKPSPVGEPIDLGVSFETQTSKLINDNIGGISQYKNIIDEADLSNNGDQFYYHGTNIINNGGLSAFVDKKGNLTLKATEQNVGKKTTVSVTEDIPTAKDYATRLRGEGPNAKLIEGAAIFKINKKYLPDAEIQSGTELTVSRDIVIPSDGWELAPLRSNDSKFIDQFNADLAEMQIDFSKLSNQELLEKIVGATVKKEVDEFNSLGEDLPSGLGRAGNDYIQWQMDKFGGNPLPDMEEIVAARVLIERKISNEEINNIIQSSEKRNDFEFFGPYTTKRLELYSKLPDNIRVTDLRADYAKIIGTTDQIINESKQPKLGGVGSREPANLNYEPYVGPEKFYLPRIFLPEQVSAKADAVRKTMIDWYLNPENYPDGIVPKRSEIVDRVDSEMNGMMKLGTIPGPSGNRPSFTRSRSIDIPNEVFADLGVIDMDISNVMQYYARRAGMGLEYARAFGSPDADLAISRTMLRVAEESKAGTVDDIFKEINNLKGEAENIRDIQLGTIFAENADSIGRRSSSLIRSWFAVTSMGGALMNSLMEMVRPAMVLGIRNNFDFALKALGNVESLKKMSAEQREKLTAAHELAAGQTFRRFFDNGIDAGVAISRTSKMLEKVEGPLAYLARTPLYLLNGVGVLTHYQKQFTGFIGSDMFAQRIMRVANNTASKDDALFLVDYGISLDDARKMATMPIEKDKGIMFANTAAWPDKDLADKFYQAVQALQDRVITTPTTADKPSVMMGVLGKGATRKEASMLGVPFQLKSWGFAANNKILLSGLQGRDANLMSGVLMLFGAGYLVSSLKTPESMWNNMDANEQILMGLEASGVFGLYGDLNFMIEQMSQDSIGLRPLMSMNPKRGNADQYDALGEVFGPGPSKMLDIYKSFSSPYATSRDRANSVIRSIPFNNLIWIPQSFRALGRDTLETVL